MGSLLHGQGVPSGTSPNIFGERKSEKYLATTSGLVQKEHKDSRLPVNIIFPWLNMNLVEPQIHTFLTTIPRKYRSPD